MLFLSSNIELIFVSVMQYKIRLDTEIEKLTSFPPFLFQVGSSFFKHRDLEDIFK